MKMSLELAGDIWGVIVKRSYSSKKRSYTEIISKRKHPWCLKELQIYLQNFSSTSISISYWYIFLNLLLNFIAFLILMLIYNPYALKSSRLHSQLNWNQWQLFLAKMTTWSNLNYFILFYFCRSFSCKFV